MKDYNSINHNFKCLDTQNNMTSNKKKNILIGLFHDYHLFGYFEYLIPALLERNYTVTLLTCDKDLRDKYAHFSKDPHFHIQHSCALRVVIRLMNNVLLRPFLWCFGWVWSFLKSRHFDAVIVPRDSKPFMHMIAFWKPSIVCQPGMGTDEKLYLKYKYEGGIDFPWPLVKTPPSYKMVDRIFGGGITRVVRGRSARRYYTVMGEDFREFYEKIGINPEHIFVTGNPNYEGMVVEENVDYGVAATRKDLGLDEVCRVITFFASQLVFSSSELDHLDTLINQLPKGHKVLLKIHPRMAGDTLRSLHHWASQIGVDRVQIVEGFSGDRNNVRLIKISEAVLVEGSNVGILAAWLDVPLFVVNLSGVRSNRSIYTLYNGVLDVSGADRVADALSVIENGELRDQLVKAQGDMMKRISKKLESPNQKIVDVLDRILTQDIER